MAILKHEQQCTVAASHLNVLLAWAEWAMFSTSFPAKRVYLAEICTTCASNSGTCLNW